MSKLSKRFQEVAKLIEREKQYLPEEAISLAKKAATSKFDETVEVHLALRVDPKQAEQQVRGVATLPHGLGKSIRVIVFAQGEAASAAQEAGADQVGADDLIKKIEEGWLEFDVAMATPDMMSRVGRLGRILGKKGLMPNPKSGTVVAPENLSRAVQESRKGRVEFRMDKTAILHVPFGKTSFQEQALVENLASLMDTVMRSRPGGVKGQYLRSAFLTTTMGPSIPLDVSAVSSLKAE